MLLNTIEMAPADPILGLTDAFKADTNVAKINLGVGVYQDATGKTPTLESVKEAAKQVIASETTKSYLPITGDPGYGAVVQQMLFGDDHAIITDKRAATAHTPGGTGALRVAGDFIHRKFPGATIWLSDPTWANHKAIFESARVPVKTYAYLDAARTGLDFDAMTAGLANIAPGDVVLLHACCHNPTGVDPNIAQWKAIAELIKTRGAFPLVDFAYQGFGDGLEEDAAGLRALLDICPEVMICSSFSKNFGLYRERVGAFTLVAADSNTLAKAVSHVKICIRTNYSNPPAHGAALVTTILNDASLQTQWEAELTAMRARINEMRQTFVKSLADAGATRDYSFIASQRGMFSFSGLNPDQVRQLQADHAVYIVGSGRINVAGMTADNMDRLCKAIVAVGG